MVASLAALFRSTPPVAMAAMPMNTFKVIFAMSFMMVVGFVWLMVVSQL